MKIIPDGFQNEYLFVLEFNNKKIKDLNPLLKEVTNDLFPFCGDNSIIKAWRNHNPNEKGDIILKIGNYIRSISIKKGSRNSVHVESLKTFEYFLKTNGVNQIALDEYKKFHYGFENEDSTDILSSKEYCTKNIDKINLINNELIKIPPYIIADRFILKGRVSIYEVDGLIYGTPNDFFWINKKHIKEIIKNNLDKKSTSVHYSSLFIQPLNRCISENNKYQWKKDYIQVKWYSLFDDIIKYKCDNKNLLYEKVIR